MNNFKSLNAALYDAARNGKYEDVKNLVEKGADVNAKSNYNRTPLHAAALNGHYEVVKHLVEKGADVNAKDNYNKTPLQIATRQRHEEIVAYLTRIQAEKEASARNVMPSVPPPEQDNCIICFDPRNGIYAFQPCGHAVACETCCMRLLVESENQTQNLCPCCRTVLTHYQKIFVN